MSKKDIIVADVNSIEVVTDTNKIPYLFSLDKIEKANCKLCKSDFRDKAEEIYDNQKRKNYSEIKRRLKDDDDFDISVPAVKNHILYHHKVVQNNASLQEYADDLQKWANMNTNRVSALKSRITILEREMVTIAQQGEDLDIIERRKNAETVKKLAESILAHEDKLKDFQEEVKPVNLIFNQLQVIVKDEMQYIENVKTKKVLSTILSRLQDSVGDMMIE